MSAVSAKINANLLDVVQQERIEEPGAEMSDIVLINMTIRVLPDPSPHWSKSNMTAAIRLQVKSLNMLQLLHIPVSGTHQRLFTRAQRWL